MVRGIVRTSQQEWESGTQAPLIEAAVLGLSLFQESSFPPSSGLFLFSSLPSFLQQIFIEHLHTPCTIFDAEDMAVNKKSSGISG